LLIAFRSPYSLKQILIVARWIIGVLFGILFLGFAIPFFRSSEVSLAGKSLSSKKLSHFDYAKMLSGPLALKENTRSPLALALEQKLALLAQSMRPDLKQEDRAFSIGINGSDAKCFVKEGEKIYFQMQQHPSGGIETFTFVENPTENWMTPHVLDGRSLLLKVEGGARDAMEVVLQAQNSNALQENNIEGISALKEARWWEPDLFFRQYGGPQFQALGKKQKIEIVDGNLKYVLFVSPGDFLSFSSGKWHPIEDLSKSDPRSPLAQVRMINQRQLEIEAWNSEGFSLGHTRIEPKKGALSRISPEKLLIGPKLRSANQVTCHLDKKRYILRPGDWLLRTKNGWHKLKALGEIDAYINQETRGELLVIDSIDPSGIRAHYFDEMRTQIQELVLPISIDKTTKTFKKKSNKRSRLSNI